MLKYISSTKLNLAIVAQIAGIFFIVKATPISLLVGIALFVLGAIWYRRELKVVFARRGR